MNIRSKIMPAGIALAALFCFPSCPYVEEYGYDYKPIFMTRAELEASVKFADQPKPLREAGKIYVFGDQLFICEPYNGVHVIDNSNPYDPHATDFIEIPGCVDIAVKDSILYADNAVDLVAVDLVERKEVAREQNAFKSIAPPTGWWWIGEEDKDKIIVGFKKIEKSESITTY